MTTYVLKIIGTRRDPVARTILEGMAEGDELLVRRGEGDPVLDDYTDGDEPMIDVLVPAGAAVGNSADIQAIASANEMEMPDLSDDVRVGRGAGMPSRKLAVRLDAEEDVSASLDVDDDEWQVVVTA